MKKIVIDSVTRNDSEGQSRLNYSLKVNNDGKENNSFLWFEVDKSYKEYWSYEIIDGIVVMLFSYALRGGYSIESSIPISKALYYQIKYQLIPELRLCDEMNYAISIDVPLSDIQYSSYAVGTGLSCGVDSFTTLFEYTNGEESQFHKLSHVTFFENGAHHLGSFGYNESMNVAFQQELEHVENFCSKYNLNLVVMKSNLNQWLSENFWNDSYHLTNTYRNVGMVLLLQKLFSVYLYSPAYNCDSFKCSLFEDSGHYEKMLLPILSTNNTVFYNSNEAFNRINKTEYISHYSETYDHLLVCYVSGRNCGKCIKCIRTLITLDFLGKLDLYSKSFDIEYYQENRKWYLSYMCQERFKDHYMKELFSYAKKNNISIPVYSMIRGTLRYIGKVVTGKYKKDEKLVRDAFKI